jgi:predicted ATPase/class 3 adenylate cyclase/Tfp pilus assembly protein PilF
MLDAPIGQVTLVFTDVEDSTVLWDQVPDGMREALALHDAIMRETLGAAQGYEVKSEGDAFMVAFASAPAAVGWCLQVQERLMAADWPAEILGQDEAREVLAEDGTPLLRGLRVRMGAHAGTPICQPDPNTGRMDDFGGVVNRAARVGGAGHGGQILVSGSAWQEIGGEADGAEVIDLGEHALKGLERREHLRQILPAALAGRSFERIKTPNLKKTNLPARLDSFFGREPEMDDLEKRLADGQRLITLLGAGGTGKTRLSQRFGGKMLAQFTGGVWFADLTEARSLSGILSAMGTALDVPLIQKDPMAQLADAILGCERVLIILDNFEQVVEHGAETVGRWLQRAPEAVFLVSSRTLLRIEGEEVLYLDPLPVAEAVNLFYDRGRAVQPSFARCDDNEPIVTEICERLDCMSLAIELAAARVRMLAPEQIRQRLSQRFKLLRGQRRDLSDRQATLRGAIDWSWDLLKPQEQSTLAQLAIFRGGCTLEAAEAVTDLADFEDEPWVMDTVEALVDHSLLRRTEPLAGHSRYRMLESVREYAMQKLGDGAPSAALRQAQYFATFGNEEFLDSLDRHGGVQRRQRLALEIENLVGGAESAIAASEWGLAAYCGLAATPVFQLQGPYRDGVALLNLVSLEGLDRPLSGRLLFARGILYWLVGRPTDGVKECQKALTIYRQTDNRRGEGKVLCVLGGQHQTLGQMAQASGYFEAALAAAREVSDRKDEGMALANLGTLNQIKGEPVEALTYYEQALTIHREVGNRRNEGLTLGNLGTLEQFQRRYVQARRCFEQALLITREVGNRRFEGSVLGNLGALIYETGDLAAAEQKLAQAIEISDQVHPVAAAVFRGTIAEIFVGKGELEQARTTLAAAISQLGGVDRREHAKLLCKRARVEHLAGDASAACAALAEAETIAADLQPGPDSDLGQELVKTRAALAASCQ